MGPNVSSTAGATTSRGSVVTSLQQQPIPPNKSRLQPSNNSHNSNNNVDVDVQRRDFLWKATAAAAVTTVSTLAINPTVSVAAAADSTSTSLDDIVQQLQGAADQMDKIPDLIKDEKWDSVRAVLITPPIADCWAKTNKPILQKYAQLLEKAGGDEFEALENKEELVSHLRYLDMAVYNNNFNPITVEGKNGASPTLIKSYYEDPMNEYTASKKALQSLIELSKGL